MQRKVRNLGNLGRTTGYIIRVPLVKSGRVQNLGGVTYEKVDEQGRFNITVLTKGKEERGEGERVRVKLSRWITFWFAPERIPRTIWRSQRGGGGGRGGGGYGSCR